MRINGVSFPFVLVIVEAHVHHQHVTDTDRRTCCTHSSIAASWPGNQPLFWVVCCAVVLGRVVTTVGSATDCFSVWCRAGTRCSGRAQHLLRPCEQHARASGQKQLYACKLTCKLTRDARIKRLSAEWIRNVKHRLTRLRRSSTRMLPC